MPCNHPLGIACQCQRQGLCLESYQIKSDDKVWEYHSGGLPISLIKLIDSGEGVPLDITLEGQCTNYNFNCPNGVLTDNKEWVQPLAASGTQACRVSYVPQSHQPIGLLKALDLFWNRPQLSDMPYTPYHMQVTQCNDWEQKPMLYWSNDPWTQMMGQLSREVTFKVYPSFEMESSLSISFSRSKHEKTDEERFDEYIERQSKGYKTGLAVPTYETLDNFHFGGELSITQGRVKTKYGVGLEVTSSDFLHQRNLEQEVGKIAKQWSLLKGIVSVLNLVKGGSYQNAGKEKINVIDTQFGPSKVSLIGTQSLKLEGDELVLERIGKATFNPLFKFTLSLDFVLAAAEYFKLKNMAVLIREKAQELEDKVKAGQVGAYAGAEFFVTFSSELNTENELHSKLEEEDHFRAEAKVSINVGLNIRGGAKIWVMEGAFKLTAQTVAEGMIVMRPRKLPNGEERSELIFCHKGIKTTVVITTELYIRGEDESAKSIKNKQWTNNYGRHGVDKTIYSSQREEKREWIWAEALTEKESPYRVTL